MRRAAQHLPLVLLLLLVGPATSALASDWVEGDGYRFRLPPEFVSLEDSKLAGSQDVDRALRHMNGLVPSRVDMDVQVFLRQRGAEPDAYLFVMAMHVEGELKEAMTEQLDLDRLEQGMRQAQAQMDAQGALVEISRIRRILVSAGRPALELEIAVDEPDAGDLNAARMLFVLEEGTICMLGFQGTRKNASEDGMLWRAIVTSFRLEERGSILNLLLRYGPFLLGGLVLVVALVLLRRSSSRKLIRPVLASRPGAGGEAAFSRALDGLPLYGQAGGDFREPGAGEPDAPPGSLPATGPGGGPLKAPTIPRAAPATDPVAAPLVPDPVPAASGAGEPPSGGPSGLPRRLPRAQASEPAPRPASPPPPPPPLPPPLPPPPLAGPTPPAAVAQRIELKDIPVGSDMPTNVALRSARPPEPEPAPPAESAEQVLSRLMGLDAGPPANANTDTDPGPGPDDEGLAAEAGQPATPKEEGVKIQRNSDFYG